MTELQELRQALEALADQMGERCGDHCSNSCRMCEARNNLRLILHRAYEQREYYDAEAPRSGRGDEMSEEMHTHEIHELRELAFRVRAGSKREGISVDAACFLVEILDAAYLHCAHKWPAAQPGDTAAGGER